MAVVLGDAGGGERWSVVLWFSGENGARMLEDDGEHEGAVWKLAGIHVL
jgi:hypothetical protein